MDEINKQVHHMFMTGGTGILTTKSGEEIRILASTIVSVGKYFRAKTETKKEVEIQKKSILKAESA